MHETSVGRTRRNKILCSAYIDDFYIQGGSYNEAEQRINKSESFFKCLGFEISEKSIRRPVQVLPHLGFLLNSREMAVYLDDDKRNHIIDLIKTILAKGKCSVRRLAKVIGTLVASFPAVEYGRLFYRELEMIKIRSLRDSYNYEKIIWLTEESKEELKWWIQEGVFSGKVISHGNPNTIIETDASDFGYGGVIRNSEISTQGLFNETEIKLHINVKEALAVKFCVQAFFAEETDVHIQIQCDNTTTVSYINNMGGTHSKQCNEVVRELLKWCKIRNLWVSACHIAGKDNVSADTLSRKFNRNLEWSLNKEVFESICLRFGTPKIDAFASRHNRQVELYYSRFPEPETLAVDAFSVKWVEFLYIFPPFNLIPRILRKIVEDRTDKVVMVIPVWETQVWFPKLTEMLTSTPMKLPVRKDLLMLPSNRTDIHPLFPKLRMWACCLSGGNSGI